MPNRLSVTVIPDGPLKIENAKGVRYCGEPLETSGDVFLCRCGESKNAPFCDGSHQGAGFKGASEPRKRKEVEVWEGRTVRTFFNPTACMHVFYCKPLEELRKAELAGDDAAAEEIIRVVGTCPSGALTHEVKGDVEEPTQAGGADVDIVEGGEVRVQCSFDINADLHERQPADRATLCRCGMSKNKPWCDGRHKARKDFR